MEKTISKIEFDKINFAVADTSGSMQGTPLKQLFLLQYIFLKIINLMNGEINLFFIFSSDCIEYSYNKNAQFTDIIDEIPLIVDNTDIDKVFTKILNDSLEKNLPN